MARTLLIGANNLSQAAALLKHFPPRRKKYRKMVIWIL
jgi:hypothetical protein